jgi:hypothetical protein
MFFGGRKTLHEVTEMRREREGRKKGERLFQTAMIFFNFSDIEEFTVFMLVF